MDIGPLAVEIHRRLMTTLGDIALRRSPTVTRLVAVGAVGAVGLAVPIPLLVWSAAAFLAGYSISGSV